MFVLEAAMVDRRACQPGATFTRAVSRILGYVRRARYLDHTARTSRFVYWAVWFSTPT
jgi:hypothetical protein